MRQPRTVTTIVVLWTMVILVVVFIIGLNAGTQKEDFQAFEDCILDQYDMSSTQYYSLTGTQPICVK